MVRNERLSKVYGQTTLNFIGSRTIKEIKQRRARSVRWHTWMGHVYFSRILKYYFSQFKHIFLHNYKVIFPCTIAACSA